jgi:hypothetical protein
MERKLGDETLLSENPAVIRIVRVDGGRCVSMVPTCTVIFKLEMMRESTIQ